MNISGCITQEKDDVKTFTTMPICGCLPFFVALIFASRLAQKNEV